MLPIWILIAVTAAVIIWLIFFRKRGGYPGIEDRVFSATRRDITPLGVEIWLEGEAKVTLSDKNRIDEGLMACFQRARNAGYTLALDHRQYKVCFLENPERSPESGTLSYRLPAGPYAGTKWDMGGYILAAGQMIMADYEDGNLIALPEHNGQDQDSLRTIADYEAEHVVLCYNDGEKYEATKIHGQGQGHPLIP